MSSDRTASNVDAIDPVSTPINRRKLAAHFVDDVSNISIAPNGACRIHFNTWSTDDTGATIRVESELIMTIQSLMALAKALPGAIRQANQTRNVDDDSDS